MPKDTRPYPQKARERIKAGKIIGRLIKHVEGTIELSQTQIQAARILLAKALPDLTAVEHSGEIGSKTEKEMTRDELLRIAASGSTGDSTAGRGKGKPVSVH